MALGATFVAVRVGVAGLVPGVPIPLGSGVGVRVGVAVLVGVNLGVLVRVKVAVAEAGTVVALTVVAAAWAGDGVWVGEDVGTVVCGPESPCGAVAVAVPTSPSGVSPTWAGGLAVGNSSVAVAGAGTVAVATDEPFGSRPGEPAGGASPFARSTTINAAPRAAITPSAPMSASWRRLVSSSRNAGIPGQNMAAFSDLRQERKRHIL
ncbi:MAG TPA: hypothetical protein PKD27_08140 [Tepidiformaceae bacterium]|nr:hypothetical protein [Tepidiformaceae bacterium]